MNTRLFKMIAAIPGVPMLLNAILFMAQPERAVGSLGMPLLDGIGRSTQLADFGAFFAFCAIFIFYGVIKSKSDSLRMVAILLGLAAAFRVIAWMLNGAALASALIISEVILLVWLLLSAHYMDKLTTTREG